MKIPLHLLHFISLIAGCCAVSSCATQRPLDVEKKSAARPASAATTFDRSYDVGTQDWELTDRTATTRSAND